MALTLTHDLHHDVRAAGARVLPQLIASKEDVPLVPMKRARLRELIADQGTVVPWGALVGLGQAAASGLPIASEFYEDAERLLRLHPSHRVRSAAAAFKEAVAGTRKSAQTQTRKPLS